MQPLQCECAADYSTLSDEQLAMWARRPGGAGAFLHLALRLYSWINARICRLCRRFGLSTEDKWDLRQQAFLLLDRVVADYDPHLGGTFRSFLSRRLDSLVRHQARAYRRDYRRLQLIGPIEVLEHQAAVAAGHGSAHAGPFDATGGDPVLILERRELADHLRRELEQLPPQYRSVVEAGASDRRSLRLLARYRGLSVRTLQLWRQKGLAILRSRLRP
jgi:RNA polymerase sigma factor (sigma-70 family)